MTGGNAVTVQMEREVVDGKRLSTLWVGLCHSPFLGCLSCALIHYSWQWFLNVH